MHNRQRKTKRLRFPPCSCVRVCVRVCVCVFVCSDLLKIVRGKRYICHLSRLLT